MVEPRYAAPPDRRFQSYREMYENSYYNIFPQEHRSGGSMGATFLSVHQDPIDLIDPATPALVVVLTRGTCNEVGLDAGDGLRIQRNLAADTITVTPPLTEQRFMVRDPHSLTCVALDGGRTTDLLIEHGLDREAWAPFVARMHRRPDIAASIRALWARSSGRAAQDELHIDGLTLQLLAQLCDDPALSPILDDRADTRIVRAIDYLEAHLAFPLSIADLAAIAAMSAGHFSRCFKATTGEAVWAYVQRRRCERARDMVLHSREPLTEIAYRTGFANQAHMTRSLKARYSTTPGAMRA